MIQLPQLPPMVGPLCAEANPEAWFPGPGDKTDKAKAICARCPDRLPCLEEALERREEHGIWGGLGTYERNLLLKRRAA